MTNDRVIIFGIGQLGELMYYMFNKTTSHEVVAFTADEEYINCDNKYGVPIIPFEQVKREYTPSDVSIFVAIGYSDNNKVREEKYTQVTELGYDTKSYIHPSATVADNSEIGKNCIIFENTTIQPFTSIGNDTIVWSGSTICHHSVIDNHCFIAPNATICGSVGIENNCFIGANSTITDEVDVAPRCVVGAGTTIISNTDPGYVYIGEPAKVYSTDSTETKL